jgi:hypothetical protein
MAARLRASRSRAAPEHPAGLDARNVDVTERPPEVVELVVPHVLEHGVGEEAQDLALGISPATPRAAGLTGDPLRPLHADGSLVMVIVASGAVAFVVWFAVKLAVTLPAVALSRL